MSGRGASQKGLATRNADIERRIESLADLTREQLVEEWRRLYRAFPPERVRRDLLELAIAWKWQEQVLGGLKKKDATELRRMAHELATSGEISRSKSPVIKPGARLIREWAGRTHEVIVQEDGYLFRNTHFASLTAIATEITGTHWSGPRFFGITRRTTKVRDGEEGAIDG